VNRHEMLARVEGHQGQWDLIIVGGGATGAGVAVDAASRGYTVLLLEQSDFDKGTSGRSTKLVHGRSIPRAGKCVSEPWATGALL